MFSENPKDLFDILEMDERLGRLITADDLGPFSLCQRTRRDAAKRDHHEDPAIAAIYAQVPVLEDLLGIKLHVDHVFPISKGGRHVADNLQIIPASTNLLKSNKTLFKYQSFQG